MFLPSYSAFSFRVPTSTDSKSLDLKTQPSESVERWCEAVVGAWSNTPSIQNEGGNDFSVTMIMLAVLVRYLRIHWAEILDQLSLFMPVLHVCYCIFWLIQGNLWRACIWDTDAEGKSQLNKWLHASTFISSIYFDQCLCSTKNSAIKAVFWESCSEVTTEFVLCKISDYKIIRKLICKISYENTRLFSSFSFSSSLNLKYSRSAPAFALRKGIHHPNTNGLFHYFPLYPCKTEQFYESDV